MYGIIISKTNKTMKTQDIDYERGGRQKEFYLESELIYVSCPLCNKDKYREIHRERGALKIVRCLHCGLIYVNPRLKKPDEVYRGDADKYFKEARLIFEGKAQHHRDQNYLQDLKIIYRYKPSGNFLDIGTNMGFFLRKAKDWHWHLWGVEPSLALSEIARRYFGLNVKTAFLEEAGFEDDIFDIISMTDVFEHISEPGKILKEIQRILKSNGILFIKVPNGLFNLFKFQVARITKKLEDYDLFDSYEHVVHYSEMTLRNTLEKYGFKVIRVFIGKPIQLPVWHKYVGYYYQYPSPWYLDIKKRSFRVFLYFLSLLEFKLRLNHAGYLAPNIILIAKKS